MSYFTFLIKSSSIAFFNVDEIITSHSSIFLLPLFGKILGKRVILIDFGDWPQIMYYKLLFILGSKAATLFAKFFELIRFILASIVDEYYTNSPKVYMEMRGRAKFHARYALAIIEDLRRFYAHSCRRSKRRAGLLYVGRLDSEKGVDRLLRAYVRARRFDVPLVIVGDGPLRELVCRLSQKVPGIVYVGALPYERVFEYYATYRYVVIPSYSEGFPRVLLEALVCGNEILIFKELEIFKRFASRVFSDENELADFIRSVPNVAT